MAQNITKDNLTTLNQDWGGSGLDVPREEGGTIVNTYGETSDLKPFSGLQIQQFIKGQLGTKFGHAVVSGSYMIFYDKEGGTEIFRVSLGKVYQITLTSATSPSFDVLKDDGTKVITITPTSKQGEIGGGEMRTLEEDYTWIVEVAQGEGAFVVVGSGTCLTGNSFSYDVFPRLALGANRIRFSVTGNTSHQTETKTFFGNLTELTFRCEHAWWQAWKQGSAYSLNGLYFSGRLVKVLHYKIDDDAQQEYTQTYNEDTYYDTTPTSIALNDAKFPTHAQTSSRVSKIEVWMTNQNGTISTKHYVFYLMCVKTGTTPTLCCINEAAEPAVNYANQTLFKYAVFGTNSATISATANEGQTSYVVIPSTTYGGIMAEQANTVQCKPEINTESQSGVSLISTVSVTGGYAVSKEVTVDNSNAYASVPNAAFVMNPSIRGNGDSNKTTIINSATGAATTTYAGTWNAFSWYNDGWSSDAAGNKCLSVKAGSTLSVPTLKPLDNLPNGSMTIELKMKASNVADYNSPILSFMDTATYDATTTKGIVIFPTKVLVLPDTERSVPVHSVDLQEGEMVHIAIVFHRNYNDTGRHLCRIYINGMPNAVFEFNVLTITNAYLRAGQASADLDIYMMRYYIDNQGVSGVLETGGILKNYLNTLMTSESIDRDTVKSQNDLLSGGRLSYELCKRKGYNTMVVETVGDEAIPSYAHQAKVYSTLSLEYAGHEDWNWCMMGGRIDGQGTTSKMYHRWNLRSKDTNNMWCYKDIMNSSAWAANTSYAVGDIRKKGVSGMYICKTAHISGQTFDATCWDEITATTPWNTTTLYHVGDIRTSGGKAYKCKEEHTSGQTFDATKWTLIAEKGAGVFDGYDAGGSTNHPKVVAITAKKNIASSPQGHKMGACAMYDELFKELNLHTSLPSGARVATYQYPVMGFQKMANGSYNFIGLYTVGPDKGDANTFGYDTTTYPNMMSIEGPNHAPLGTRFIVPWVDVAYSTADETLKFGGEEGWDLDYYNSTLYTDATAIKGLYEAEWKPAYELVFNCSPWLKSLTETCKTLAEINADVTTFRDGYDLFTNRTNGIATLYDSSYNLVYYSNQDQIYKTLDRDNLLTYLAGYLNNAVDPTHPTTAELVAARKAKFTAEMGNLFDKNSAIYCYCYCVLIGASDNFAKNSYPFKLQAFNIDPTTGVNTGGKWMWRQDDLDTILPFDNNGNTTKDYFIDPGDMTVTQTAGGTAYNDIFQGFSSAFWQLIEQCFPSDIAQMMDNIVSKFSTMAGRLGVSTSYAWSDVLAMFNHYFWKNSSKYFPMRGYNEDAYFGYVSVWELDPTASAYPVNPLSQAKGSQFEAELQWASQRIMYLMSKYSLGAFKASQLDDGMGQLVFTPASSSFTFNIKPAIYMYPAASTGGNTPAKGGRTSPSQTSQLTVSVQEANTGVYLKGLDYISELGDLSGLALTIRSGSTEQTISFSVVSQRLRKLILGAASGTVAFNANAVSASGQALEEVDVRRCTHIQRELNLSDCPRLRKLLMEGSTVPSFIIPAGAKVSQVSLPPSPTSLYLNNLPVLSSLTLPATAKVSIQSLYARNCPNLDAFGILTSIISTANNALRYVTMLMDNATGSEADIDTLYELTDDSYGYVDYSEANKTYSPKGNDKPNLQGSLTIAEASITKEFMVNAIRLNFKNLNLAISHYSHTNELIFECESSATVKRTHYTGSTRGNYYYSLDNTLTWHTFPYNTPISFGNGVNICIKGDRAAIQNNDFMQFTFTGTNIKAKGCINAIHNNGSGSIVIPSGNYTFGLMFKGCGNLTSVSKNLLPSTTLNYYCYLELFYGTNITEAPILPAPTLESRCYAYMFRNCRQLQWIKCLATSYFVDACYNWLEDVTSTGVFVQHINATWERGDSGIPNNWTIVYYDPNDDKHYLDKQKTQECDDHGNPITAQS